MLSMLAVPETISSSQARPRAMDLISAAHVFSASSRLFDVNGEVSRVRKKQSSAIIAPEVQAIRSRNQYAFSVHTPDRVSMVRATNPQDALPLAQGLLPVAKQRRQEIAQDPARSSPDRLPVLHANGAYHTG